MLILFFYCTADEVEPHQERESSLNRIRALGMLLPSAMAENRKKRPTMTAQRYILLEAQSYFVS